MTNFSYDYDVAKEPECEYPFEIFEIRTGKVVDHADSREEALQKVEKLELAKALNG